MTEIKSRGSRAGPRPAFLFYLEILRRCLVCRPSNRQTHGRRRRTDSWGLCREDGSFEELASVRLVQRGEGARRENEPGSLSLSLLWRLFIQRPLVSYQLKGLGHCFSTILLVSLPPLLNLSSHFPTSEMFCIVCMVFSPFNNLKRMHFTF